MVLGVDVGIYASWSVWVLYSLKSLPRLPLRTAVVLGSGGHTMERPIHTPWGEMVPGRPLGYVGCGCYIHLHTPWIGVWVDDGVCIPLFVVSLNTKHPLSIWDILGDRFVYPLSPSCIVFFGICVDVVDWISQPVSCEALSLTCEGNTQKHIVLGLGGICGLYAWFGLKWLAQIQLN